MNASEISAQEAVYTLLGQHMSESSNAHIFINTYPPAKRVRLLKSRAELHSLAKISPDSNDIYIADTYHHYVNRPDDLENTCLADFVALYEFSRSYPSIKNVDNDCSDLEDDNDSEDDDEESKKGIRNENVLIIYALKDKSGYIKQRKKAKIIRFKTYDIKTDSYNYYRTKLTLYLPFRQEETEVACPNVKTIFDEKIEIIIENEKKYNKMITDMTEIIEEMENEENNEDEGLDGGDQVSGAEDEKDEFKIYGIRKTEHDIVLDFPALKDRKSDDVTVIKLPPRIKENNFQDLITSLNCRQREYLQHLLQKIESRKSSYNIVTGGAGVGKSTLIKAVYESATRFYESRACNNGDNIKVLLCAPTGKAAFNIDGSTLHSVFSLPFNQLSGKLSRLSDDKANTIRTKYIDLQFQIFFFH